MAYNAAITMHALLARHWFLGALLLGVGWALTLPRAPHAALKDLPPPIVIALALFLMAWTMPSRSLAGELRRPWAALWAVTLSYSFVPGAAWLLGELSATHEDVRIGLLLAASVPCTLASCVLWTRLAGGNEATALLAVLTSTLASWCFTTLWLALATGAQVALPVEQMMRDLALTLIIPVALGQAVRCLRLLSAFADRYKGPLGMVAQLFVLAIILKASASVGVAW